MAGEPGIARGYIFLPGNCIGFNIDGIHTVVERGDIDAFTIRHGLCPQTSAQFDVFMAVFCD
jgi:hypothetical protein